MKKIMTMVALAAMTLGFVACGDDDPITRDEVNFGVTDLVSKTVTGDNFFDYTGLGLRMHLNYLSDTAYMAVVNTKFSAMQPFPVSFALTKLGITYTDRSRFKLSSTTSYDPLPGMGYQVNNVRMSADLLMKAYYLTYTVTSNHATSQVYVYPQSILTTLEDDDVDYANAKEFYATFTAKPGQNSTYEGNVLLTDVQFSIGTAKSPVMTIRIPYDEHVTITPNKRGYTVTGSGITGLYRQGESWIPFEQSTIDNLAIDVDVVNKQYSIFFNCMEYEGVPGEFESSGKLYL